MTIKMIVKDLSGFKTPLTYGELDFGVGEWVGCCSGIEYAHEDSLVEIEDEIEFLIREDSENDLSDDEFITFLNGGEIWLQKAASRFMEKKNLTSEEIQIIEDYMDDLGRMWNWSYEDEETMIYFNEKNDLRNTRFQSIESILEEAKEGVK